MISKICLIHHQLNSVIICYFVLCIKVFFIYINTSNIDTYIRLNFKDRCQCPHHFDIMFQQLLLEQLLQLWLLEQLLPTKVIGTRKNHETNVCSNNHCWNSCSNNDRWNGRSNKGCWNKDQPRNKFLFQQSLLKR